MRTPPPVKVFISYAHADRKIVAELEHYLGWLWNDGRIVLFDDSKIIVGENWEERLLRELNEATIVILVVTARFLSSPYCTRTELKGALERRVQDRVRIVPIVAQTCPFERTPIGAVEARPKKDGKLKPLNEWGRDKDKALTAIANEIHELVEAIAARASGSAPDLDRGRGRAREKELEAIAEVLRNMGSSATECFGYIDQFTTRNRSCDPTSHRTIFGSLCALKDDDNWEYSEPLARDILSDWFDRRRLKKHYEPWIPIEGEWEKILGQKVHLWTGKEIVEVKSHPYIKKMYPYIIVGGSDLSVSSVLLTFCAWATRLNDLSQSLNRNIFSVKNIFYSGTYPYLYAYLRDCFIFRDIITKSEGRCNYIVDRKVTVVKSGPSFTCTVVTGVPYPEDKRSKYIEYVDNWLSEFRLGCSTEVLSSGSLA